MTLENLWKEFLKILYVEAGTNIVETWFKAISLNLWNPKEKVVELRAPNEFIRKWVSDHYYGFIEKNLGRLLNETELTIVFATKCPSKAKDNLNLAKKPILCNKKACASLPKISREEQSFENFIVGKSNNLAYNAFNAITRNLGRLYNPLIVCGEHGTGKTHLLNAVKNSIKENKKSVRVIHKSSETFTREFVSSVRNNQVQQFEKNYTSTDVLILDNIDFFAKKRQTQKIFFQIFGKLKREKKQTIFSCRSFPRSIPEFSKQDCSKLESGLTTEIKKPSLKTRIKILEKNLESRNINISQDIVKLIASRINTNVRDLKNGLSRLVAISSLTKQSIDEDLVGEAILPDFSKKRLAKLEEIINITAKKLDHSVEEIKSSKKTRSITNARQITAYLMRKFTNKSLREIAKFLNKKDHSTISHALKKIESRKAHETSTLFLLESLEKSISTKTQTP